MDGFTKLVKKKLVDEGCDNFVTEVSKILNVSQSTASRKLSGNIDFSFEDVSILTVKLGITSQELMNMSNEAVENYFSKKE